MTTYAPSRLPAPIPLAVAPLLARTVRINTGSDS